MAHKLSHMGVLIFRTIFPLDQTHIRVCTPSGIFHDFSHVVLHSPCDLFIIHNLSTLTKYPVSNRVNTHPSILILKIFATRLMVTSVTICHHYNSITKAVCLHKPQHSYKQTRSIRILFKITSNRFHAGVLWTPMHLCCGLDLN